MKGGRDKIRFDTGGTGSRSRPSSLRWRGFGPVRTRELIGDKYVNLSPGASDRMIPTGGKIRETGGALDLEGLIGEFIHGSAKK